VAWILTIPVWQNRFQGIQTSNHKQRLKERFARGAPCLRDASLEANTQTLRTDTKARVLLLIHTICSSKSESK
jgi:hypothetical protein